MNRLVSQFTWLAVLLTSVPVLVWRMMDFTYEAEHEGFHMTRGGLAVRSMSAEVLQLAIIVVCIALVWKATKNLIRVHPTGPSR
jgi:hypothetical protein